MVGSDRSHRFFDDTKFDINMWSVQQICWPLTGLWEDFTYYTICRDHRERCEWCGASGSRSWNLHSKSTTDCEWVITLSFSNNFFECQQHSVHSERALRLFLGKSRLGKYSIVCPESFPFAALIYTYDFSLRVKACESAILRDSFLSHKIALFGLVSCMAYISDPYKMALWNLRKLPHSTVLFCARFLSNGFTSDFNSGWLFYGVKSNVPSSVICRIYMIIKIHHARISRIPISHSTMKCPKNTVDHSSPSYRVIVISQL